MSVLLPLIKDIGFPFFVAVSLGWYMHTRDKSHTAERQEWRKATENQQDDIKEVIQQNNEAIRELSIVVNGLNGVVTGFLHKALDKKSS